MLRPLCCMLSPFHFVTNLVSRPFLRDAHHTLSCRTPSLYKSNVNPLKTYPSSFKLQRCYLHYLTPVTY
ncbi:Uncharacterised protein [Serratia fonticola]|nr:Uncharacterised protein [Serratia fonticola]CAI1141019.1 Uncharacterised protein [Serratia fonticola]CAI1607945.1 Uncharacterised protein [Serratia fonticola]CAI1681602.1 Uncharacterised protein [Serratia fonticola]CAI1822749.1 Uncharacterised protein [Serratia fonticola]